MDAEQAKALREPFLPAEIGKLPKPTKATNEKGRCDVCKGWHGLPAVHLDYVGHAACTDRLLKVDPEWNWRPMARGPQGEPLLVNGGLWIELTICGVTRPGFGDESNGKGMKEMIGDAIRNAAMRFGVALDLWTKEDLWSRQNESEGSGAADRMVGGPPEKAGVAEGANEPAAPATNTTNGEVKLASEAQRRRLFAIKKEHDVDDSTLRWILHDVTGQESTAQIPADKYDKVIEALATQVPFA